MKNKINAILSIVVLALFGLFAMASFGSTNTEIVVTECGSKPPFTGKLTIDIDAHTIDGSGANVEGTIFLVHQIITDTTTCKHDVESSIQIPFQTNDGGSFKYMTTNFTHKNEGDLWRVEVYIPAEGANDLNGDRSMQAAIYNQIHLTFDYTDLNVL